MSGRNQCALGTCAHDWHPDCTACGQRVTVVGGMLCITEAAWKRGDRLSPRSKCPRTKSGEHRTLRRVPS